MFDRVLESRTLVYALAIVLLSVMMMPIYWTVVTAFKPDVETYVFPPVYFPSNPTFAPFELLFDHYPFWDYLRNSVIVASATTILVTFTGMLAAYGISHYPFKGANLAIVFLLVTRIIPPLSLLLPFYLLVSWLGLVDNLLSMILANIYLTYPFAVLIMKSFFDAFPKELIDSAIVDGCSRTGAFMKIVLPVGAPGIASAGIITFLWTWNEFIYAFVFTQTSQAQPLTVGCFDAIGDVFVNWNQMCAGALIAALPGILFVFFAQKYLITGLTQGAMKY
ncbi:MAG TPA: carbohydrate ABC transporter permease [Thermodesulfobacteriota bacterium]|nr:carbohydrate ABC transporter permease [Thermodesulfobacteriota bacterium]